MMKSQTPRISAVTGWVLLLISSTHTSALGAPEANSTTRESSITEASTSPFTSEVINEVDEYLNGIKHLQGDFTQIAPDGSYAEGIFYMRRPGRIRFEYAAPNELLVVADGTWLIVQDQELDTVDRYPLSSTPLGLILRKHVNLQEDATITGIDYEPGIVRLSLRDRDEPAQGEVTLEFAGPVLELRQWTITDPQGLQTKVALSNLKAGKKASAALFRVEDDSSFSPFDR